MGDEQNGNRVPTVVNIPTALPNSIVAVETEDDISEGQLCDLNRSSLLQNYQVPLEQSTICINNSSDVVIGPLTQFHGPVTIYQNVNSFENISNHSSITNEKISFNPEVKLVKSDSASSEKPTPNEKYCCKPQLIWITSAVVLLVLIFAVTGFYTIKAKTTIDHTVKENNETDVPDFLGEHKVYSRKDWGGREPNFTRQMKIPITYVIISHTAGLFCYNFDQCSPNMRNIQSLHVSQNSPDIGYNFLIGGDGGIYVGRGWDVRNFHMDSSIGISLMGNFLYDTFTQIMINATKLLIAKGVIARRLAENYKLVCHNQTYATESPGKNVYAEVKTWEHFYPGKV